MNQAFSAKRQASRERGTSNRSQTPADGPEKEVLDAYWLTAA